MIRGVTACLALWCAPAGALTLDFPVNAERQSETVSPLGSYPIPLGPWAEGGLPTHLAEGTVTRQAWRIASPGLTTLQILDPLRDQISAAGFEILYACETQTCGGFDFRFATEVLAPPEMFVDLSDFRYLGARDGARYLSLIVSRSAQAGFVQVTSVTPPDGDGIATQAAGAAITGLEPAALPPPEPATAAPAPVVPDYAELPADLGAQLESLGRVVLSDLTFAVGSADLGPGPFASLDALAAYLAANPTRRVALVGHTDSLGSLDGNIALSKRRAQSVLERMVVALGTDRAQLEGEGMGYLAPIASNLTEEGREANRRVEVIMLSLE